MPMKVLLVEDSAVDARIVRELLERAGGREIVLRRAARLGAGLQMLEAEPPDAIILDLSLPDSRGLETLRRARNALPTVPIVILTGQDDAAVAVQAIGEGAADYLIKGDLSGELLVRALRYGVERKRTEAVLRRTQEELAVKNRIAHLLLTLPNETLYAGVLEEVLQFTQSRDGMFGYMDPERALVCATIRGCGRKSPKRTETLRLRPQDWTGAWGRALAERRPVWANTPADAEMEPGVRRVFAVPLLEGEWLIGLLAISNRESDYDAADQEFVEQTATYLAPPVHARMQREAHEKALAAAVVAKEVLLREVHHRVKNNLQIVASLLNIQAEALPEALRLALDESQRRVRSMALVHEQLYTCERPDQLDFGEYVDSLTQDLFAAYSIRPEVVGLRRDLESVLLPVDQAVPCGLILNELMTNALKHGFPDGRSGEIHVDLHAMHGEVVLRVADTGVGLPPGFDCGQCDTLGLRIVDILRHQLNGKLECADEGGASFTLRFPKPA